MKTSMLRSVSLLALASCALSASALTYTGGGGAINDHATVTSAISGVGSFFSLDSITLTGLTHTFVGDLTVRVLNSSGASVDLFVRPGLGVFSFGYGSHLNGDYTFALGGADFTAAAAAANNSFTIAPGTYSPSTTGGVLTDYAAFANSTAGSYTLTITDDTNGDTGMFTGWSLNVTPQSASAVPGPAAALPFALMALKRRKRA